jgi:hypothetical protein
MGTRSLYYDHGPVAGFRITAVTTCLTKFL